MLDGLDGTLPYLPVSKKQGPKEVFPKHYEPQSAARIVATHTYQSMMMYHSGVGCRGRRCNRGHTVPRFRDGLKGLALGFDVVRYCQR